MEVEKLKKTTKKRCLSDVNQSVHIIQYTMHPCINILGNFL